MLCIFSRLSRHHTLVCPIATFRFFSSSWVLETESRVICILGISLIFSLYKSNASKEEIVLALVVRVHQTAKQWQQVGRRSWLNVPSVSREIDFGVSSLPPFSFGIKSGTPDHGMVPHLSYSEWAFPLQFYPPRNALTDTHSGVLSREI